jgi:hypothetical protein
MGEKVFQDIAKFLQAKNGYGGAITKQQIEDQLEKVKAAETARAATRREVNKRVGTISEETKKGIADRVLASRDAGLARYITDILRLGALDDEDRKYVAEYLAKIGVTGRKSRQLSENEFTRLIRHVKAAKIKDNEVGLDDLPDHIRAHVIDCKKRK